MSIPSLTKDLAVIQKLSDLPNAVDGLSAAELKAKFDEAALEIQNWINNSLVPALRAENIPFVASTQLDAENVQAAVELVLEQISGAASGAIVNGSVTRAKLAKDVLELLYGGKAWVSVGVPSAAHNPHTEFPVGRLWLRPGFAVKNAASDNWSSVGCTVKSEQGVVTAKATGISAQADVQMLAAAVGDAGDRVYVRWKTNDGMDDTMTGLTVSLDGGAELVGGIGVGFAVLKDSTLSVRFRGHWDNASAAENKSFTIKNLMVINIDRIMRQTDHCEESSDWDDFVRELPVFADHWYSPREVYIQTGAGVWKQLDHEVFPVERGGSGVGSMGIGEMLCGSGGSSMEKITVPTEDYAFLQFLGGKPQWKNSGEALSSVHALRIATGTYTGTGTTGEVELGLEPKVLIVHPQKGPDTDSATFAWDNPTVLMPNARSAVKLNSIIHGVTLNGSKLTFTGGGDPVAAKLCNRKGGTYLWAALY